MPLRHLSENGRLAILSLAGLALTVLGAAVFAFGGPPLVGAGLLVAGTAVLLAVLFFVGRSFR